MAISKPLCVSFSFLLLLVPAFLFKKHISLLIFFYGSTTFLLVFCTSPIFRQYVTLVLFISYSPRAFGWIDRCHSSRGILEQWKLPPEYTRIFFLVLLIIQAIAGIESYVVDLARPFSGSKDAAALILSEDPDAEYLSAGCREAPVSAYLGRPIFYLNDHAYGSFCRFNRVGKRATKDPAWLKQEAMRFATKKQRAVYLITHSPLTLSATDKKYKI